MVRVFEFAILACWLMVVTPSYAESNEQDKTGKKKVVYTNADLPPAPATSNASPATPPPAPRPAVAPLPEIPSYASYRDNNGHGEGWWRKRAVELELRILDARINAQKLHVDYVENKTISDPTLALRSREATLLLRELEAEREVLPDELRVAGGLPGWLRDSGGSLPTERLPPPVLETPIPTGGLELSWNGPPEARFYIVEVQCLDCCGLPNECEVLSLDVSDKSARFPFEVGRSGRWRVRALDAAGFAGEWSAWGQFQHPQL